MGLTFKFVSLRRCPYKITVTSPGGLICLEEKQCVLMRDHDGVHRAKDGSVWQNDVQLMREMGFDT